MTNLQQAALAHMAYAQAEKNGRSSEMLVHDGPLRQSLLALVKGTELGEHNAPPAASLLVLEGSVRVTTPGGEEDLARGELSVLTHERHAVLALEDCVFLLTTVTSIPKP
ncbi:cupin [Paraoerskovia marina]|uniref:cupin n=1 Tax=Paraoerskovia marina TaxID=545619 RepID=UPI0004924A99|nr:cupin [Paraoerskovia marina]